ncbi:MAG: hypothetical protein KF752_20565 [Pirellulaceae bacterium]|nr:hypothetical protein [Pirellulaceae bacterium]
MRRFELALLGLLLLPGGALQAQNGNFVPGHGVELDNVGDDFEDPNWKYIFNEPKSTEENNEQQNLPLGKSANGRWFEGAKRGQPDVVERIDTPPGGLPGSLGSLLLQSLHTGIPNRPSHKMQQEDFILNIQYRTGGTIPISKNPSVTTRVYMPPIDQWDRRSGTHFTFRVALETTKTVPGKILVFTTKKENEVYWPGLFVCLEPKELTKRAEDRIFFRIRSNGNGGDMPGPEITTLGWWTMGLAVSANGAVHYYAKPGVEDLTAEDHIATQYPYGYRAERFRSAFFNVVNGDNGRDWTAPWIIDDTRVYLGTGPSQLARTAPTASNPAARVARQSTTPARQSTPPAAPVTSNRNALQAGDSDSDEGAPADSADLDYFR